MAIAYPFVEISLDRTGLQPVAQRAPGVLAVLGKSSSGTATKNDPVAVEDAAGAKGLFGSGTDLTQALNAAFLQNPAPSKIYGVKVDGNDWASALTAIEATDDVTFVALAGVPVKITGAATQNDPIVALKAHCEQQSAAGNKRIGVAAIDPGHTKKANYTADVIGRATGLKSSEGRMVLIAARGAEADGGGVAEVAAAAASAIAGQAPATSMVLKKIKGFQLPLATQFGPTEIKELSTDGIIPIIDPSLITGTSLHFAEGTTYTADETVKYIDVVRLLDDIEFRLKARLIGVIGDARITRTGLAAVIRRASAVLDQVQSSGGITSYSISIPVYEALLKPEATRTPGEAALINDSRADRLVDMTIVVVIGPAIHRLRVALKPRF
ncbi:MAG: hypothetical protein RL885_20460 [Planctomycetota bacterium]